MKKEKYQFFMNMKPYDMDKVNDLMGKVMAVIGSGSENGTQLTFDQCWETGGLEWQLWQCYNNINVYKELYDTIIMPLKQYVDESQPNYPCTPELYVADMQLHGDMFGQHEEGNGYDVLFGTSDGRFFEAHMDDDMNTKSYKEV